MAIVYKITNLVNGKIYIGATSKTLEIRWKGHLKDARRGSNTYFHKAIRKYGENNFSREVIHEDPDVDYVFDVLETLYIVDYKSLIFGYNTTAGGPGFLGVNTFFSMTEETKKKISESLKGRSPSDETRKKLSAASRGRKMTPENVSRITGKPRSDEVKKKISETLKGRKHTDETKRKLSEMGKIRKHTEQTKKRISEVLKGRPVTEETRKKIGNSNRGRPLTEETKRKLSEINKGKIQTEETKRKKSEAMKLVWEKRREINNGNTQ